MQTMNKSAKEEKNYFEHPIKNLFPQYERGDFEAELYEDMVKRKLDEKPFEFLQRNGVDALMIKTLKDRATITEANKLKEIIFPSIQKGSNKIILDLSHCEFMDSTFLGLIILVEKKLTKDKGKMVLVIDCDKVKIFHVMTEMKKYIDIYKTLDEAIESISKS